MRFVVRNDDLRSSCLEAIAELPLEPLHSVVIERHKPTRSNEQNNMMWRLVRAIAQGECVEQTKDRLLMMFGGYETKTLPNGQQFPVPMKGSSAMDKGEMAEFITFLQNFCIQWGIEVEL